ncbi:hypothetical protein LAC81_37735 (plasmid) [Ensifer adhaerens]|uniref:hypothetical protein n=1 Tax=Ensifer adhaerens TaxID=106592 RepID=UPI001CC112A7|nr:hypothetical protein [Ensifer adhaerens]MBZ7927680.1 hypothetical protein [Ensifer adhaerens]UAX98076.1 hypothetical protein LAC78_39035 [Ensifer adhaerens]UAY05457.1 hypothetical protein LAC80_37750 [Ensifer adhaerens]UAY12835.1 hypothetical protein LAC81_37735 [Ensifer adhaerens]
MLFRIRAQLTAKGETSFIADEADCVRWMIRAMGLSEKMATLFLTGVAMRNAPLELSHPHGLKIDFATGDGRQRNLMTIMTKT